MQTDKWREKFRKPDFSARGAARLQDQLFAAGVRHSVLFVTQEI